MRYFHFKTQFTALHNYPCNKTSSSDKTRLLFFGDPSFLHCGLNAAYPGINAFSCNKYSFECIFATHTDIRPV